MNKRQIKDLLYEQVARAGKALSSPKRLELIELLSQGSKTVEELSAESDGDFKLVSAHLRALREARLVTTTREGKNIRYALAGPDIAGLWVKLHEVAQEHLVELQVALQQMVLHPDTLTQQTRKQLLSSARAGEVVVLDVRPAHEYQTGHLPFARSMPVAELRRRLKEIPKDKPVVAYCRGPFCLFSDEAVHILRSKGYQASKLSDGVIEWKEAGMPVLEGAH
jgi:rhodanese-related sulfurtransferase/DNA-binding transcriptional ArsR family regulator